MKKIQTKWKWGIGLFLLFAAGVGFYVANFEWRAEVMEIYFFKLNRGRSVFIRTPHDKTILIDGGQNSQILRELTKLFPFYRRRIDLLVLTSSTPKNSGGLHEVVKRFDVQKVIMPALMGTSTALSIFEESIELKNILVEKVKKGESFEMDEVKFSVLFPDLNFKFNKTSTPELVLRGSHKLTTFLLLGDVSKTIQKSFIPEMETADIVEYAHSAGDARTSGDLFKKLSPKFAVMKKLIRNVTPRVPKNPPKKPPFNIEKQDETEVLNLEKEGTIHFISDGERVWRK